MLTGLIENVLNRGLADSPRARELVRELDSRRLELRVAGLGLTWRLASDGNGLVLARAPAGPAESAESAASAPVDATVEGTPLNLLALAGPDPEGVIRRGDVRIGGDAEIAERFRELGVLLRPDLEEALSRVVGDGPAHRLARIGLGLRAWTRRTGETSLRNVAEFLAHEQGDLVPRAEGAAFCADVDRLREDLDRLEARVALIDRAR